MKLKTKIIGLSAFACVGTLACIGLTQVKANDYAYYNLTYADYGLVSDGQGANYAYEYWDLTSQLQSDIDLVYSLDLSFDNHSVNWEDYNIKIFHGANLYTTPSQMVLGTNNLVFEYHFDANVDFSQTPFNQIHINFENPLTDFDTYNNLRVIIYGHGDDYDYETTTGVTFGYLFNNPAYPEGVQFSSSGSDYNNNRYYYDIGYSEGYNKGVTESSNLLDMIVAIPDRFIDSFKTIFDFEILGVNIAGLMITIISLGVVIFIIKKVV